MKTSTGLYSDNIILELDNIKKLMSAFSNPQDDLKIIHVAGTNGKGSVCSFLQSVLSVAGFKVGKFSSPDIKTPYDAISINGEDITHKKAEEFYNCIKNVSIGFSPSEFEIMTCIAFLYFKQENCDFVILETGLGGIGDATNIIASPLYSVITKISLDHTNFLGNTLEEIAEKKAGIIKCNGKTVTLFNQEKAVLKIISDKCKKENNTLIITKEPEIFTPSGIYENFCYSSIEAISGLSGLHQIENASLAIEVLKDLGIEEKYIKEGIKNAKNPGRFELISKNPPIIFDGAHNSDGLSSLLSSLKRYYPNHKKTFIIGMMKDKISEKTAEIFKIYEEDKLSEFLTVSVTGNPRSEKSENLNEFFKENGFVCESADTLSNALLKTKKDRLTVICGSLYLYRELKK